MPTNMRPAMICYEKVTSSAVAVCRWRSPKKLDLHGGARDDSQTTMHLR